MVGMTSVLHSSPEFLLIWAGAAVNVGGRTCNTFSCIGAKNAHIAASWDASLSFLIIVSSVNSGIHPPNSRSMAAEVFGPFFLENIFADESWADSIDPNTKFSCLARMGLGQLLWTMLGCNVRRDRGHGVF